MEFTADDSKLQAGLRRAQARVREFGASVQRIGVGVAAAGGAILGPMLAATRSFVQAGDKLDKMAARTGVAVEALSELKFAAEQSGSDIDAVGNAIFRMQRRVANAALGTGPAVRALEMLGFNAKELSQIAPEEQFKILADRLANLGDDTLAAQLAFEIFGDSAKGLMPLLKQGRDGIEALQKEARDAGITMSTEMASDAAALGDAMNKVNKSIEAAWLQIGGALAPAITDVANRLQNFLPRIVRWISENQSLVVTVAKVAAGTVALGTGLVALGSVMRGLAAIIGVASVALQAFGAAMTFISAHPIIAALTAITAGFAGVAFAVARARRRVGELSDEMQRLREQGDQMRAEAQAQIERLTTLAEKQRLSTVEMREAEQIIARLEGRYGNLNISLDRTAQRLDGVSAAWSRVNDAMKEHRIAEIRKEIRETEDNLRKLNEAFVRSGGIRQDEQLERINEVVTRLRVLRLELEALRETPAGEPPRSAGLDEISATPSDLDEIEPNVTLDRSEVEDLLDRLDEIELPEFELDGDDLTDSIRESIERGARQADLARELGDRVVAGVDATRTRTGSFASFDAREVMAQFRGAASFQTKDRTAENTEVIPDMYNELRRIRDDLRRYHSSFRFT